MTRDDVIRVIEKHRTAPGRGSAGKVRKALDTLNADRAHHWRRSATRIGLVILAVTALAPISKQGHGLNWPWWFAYLWMIGGSTPCSKTVAPPNFLSAAPARSATTISPASTPSSEKTTGLVPERCPECGHQYPAIG